MNNKKNSSASWTVEQLAAIEERNSNLLVAAAAGAGKTAVLVERIIQRISEEKNPVDIDKLLIVTFTNAAAAEMRERIGAALSKKLEENPDSKPLQRQLTLLNKASITTIHSFCLDVIRNNFHLIDIDPGFRIADDTEAVLLKLEALEELFEGMYDEDRQNELFFRLIECYGGNRNDQLLQDIVLNIYEFVQSNPWPKKWLEEASKEFLLEEEQDFIKTKWAETIIEELEIQLKGMSAMLRGVIASIAGSEGLETYLEALQKDAVVLDELIADVTNTKASWDTIYETFKQVSFDRLKRCGKEADVTKQELVKAVRNDIKAKLKKIREDIIYADSEELLREINYLHPLLQGLSELVMEFERVYSAKKKEKGLVDFNDLEHFCLQILIERDEQNNTVPSNTAMELKSFYEEIYIDEYQDSNGVQETLLKTISRNDQNQPNLFMVGDMKQSIYRFRQAEPSIFKNKRDTYSMEKGQPDRLILLNKNFRSRGEVLAAVNYLFYMIMSQKAGEIDYDEYEMLYTGASFAEAEEADAIVGGAVELNIIDMSSEEAETDNDADEEVGSPEDSDTSDTQIEEEELDSIQAEARLVGKRIKQLLSPQEKGQYKVFDKELGKYRAVQYKDIVILLRATKNWSEVFYDELTQEGIPVYADTSSGYFKTTEISTIMSLLEIIDNPIQDIPLLAVLRSPIAFFNAEELIEIRLIDREVPFYEALKKGALGEGALAAKISGFLEKLEVWREKAAFMGTDELLWYLYTDTGYYSLVGAMTGGLQRQANLRMLFERARQYENTSYKGLFNFISFMNKLKRSNSDFGSAKIIGENEDVVRIMSIHKSKGLEFPVVFVSGTGKRFNLMDMNKSILLHQKLGFGPDYVNIDKRISYPSIAKQAIRQKLRLESLSEEMRILYVAMTRAKEKLIITGVTKNIKGQVTSWIQTDAASDIKVPEYQVLKGRCYLDWISTAVMLHEDGAVLREACGVDVPIAKVQDINIASKWEVNIWNKSTFTKPKEIINEEDYNFLEEFAQMNTAGEDGGEQSIGSSLLERLEWKYPYAEAENIPVKLTVTELKRLINAELDSEYASLELNTEKDLPIIIKKPAFIQEKKEMTAAEKGTVLHFVMQHLDLRRVSSKEAVNEQLESMVNMELLAKKHAESVDANRIIKFFKSSLGQRMLKSERVLREIPFTMHLNCNEIFKNMQDDKYKNQKILLQGIIDCCFIENDSIVLIDYKTDYIAEAGIEDIKRRYKLQIEYYAKAIEKITNITVIEKNIYLFWNGQVISFD